MMLTIKLLRKFDIISKFRKAPEYCQYDVVHFKSGIFSERTN